ncbi:hypothetical protein FOA52_014938 [Chlamydomonas sp. UWO 241]|nr:hypothetical protein FOA52_014938 [Chlamydomonas sp. UWO 241]
MSLSTRRSALQHGGWAALVVGGASSQEAGRLASSGCMGMATCSSSGAAVPHEAAGSPQGSTAAAARSAGPLPSGACSISPAAATAQAQLLAHWHRQWRSLLPAAAEAASPAATRGYAKKTQIEYVPIPQRTWDRYTSPPTNYLQLLNAIRWAPSVERLEELMAPEYLSRFDGVHVAAALTRLPKLVRFRTKDMVPSGVIAPHGTERRALEPKSGSKPAVESAEAATSLARQLCGLLPGVQDRLFPRQAANCVWALGRLHSLGLPVVEEPRTGKRTSKAQAPPAELSGGSGPDAGALPGGGAAATVAGRDSLAAVTERLTACRMAPRFAKAYTSLLRVAAGPREDYAPLRAHATPAELGMLTKGMALLPRACCWHGLAQASWLLAATHAPRFKVPVPGELAAGCHTHAPRFKADELRAAAWALTALPDARATPSGSAAAAAAMRALGARAFEIADQFTPGGAASLMWAFAVARAPDGRELLGEGEMHVLFAALAEGLPMQVVNMVPKDVAMIAGAVARVGYHDPDLAQLLGDKAERHLEAFQPGELAWTLRSLAAPGMPHPHAGVFAAVMRSAARQAEIAPDLGPGVLGDVMAAFANGGLRAVADAATAEAVEAAGEQGASEAGKRAGNAATHAALATLRRLRAPLAKALEPRSDGGASVHRANAHELGRCAAALVALREAERCAGFNTLGAAAATDSDSAGTEGSDDGAGSADADAALSRSLVASAEALAPGCSLPELAALLRPLSALPADGLMLAAAASTQLKAQLSAAAARPSAAPASHFSAGGGGGGGGARVAASVPLWAAVDVLVAADAMALNDPELPRAVAAAALAPAAAAAGSTASGGSGSGSADEAPTALSALSPPRVAALVASCQRLAPGDVRTAALRAAAAPLLLAAAADTPASGAGGAMPAPALVAALVAYADAAANPTATAAPSSGSGDAEAVARLADALAGRVSEVTPEQRGALARLPGLPGLAALRRALLT